MLQKEARETLFEPGPERPHLGEKAVHVWRASLNQPAEVRGRLVDTLDRRELERADRFATDGLRNRYVVARGILRTLLARYLESSPDEIRFRYGEHEKPHLAHEPTRSDLQFNVSHSGELALLGLTRGREIGVDVEWTGRALDQTEIANRFFSKAESARLRSLPRDRQVEYFFALWTCKEAFVKARGEGVAFGLDRFDVRLEPDAMEAEIVSNRSSERMSTWHAHRLEPGTGYTGAVVVGCRDLAIAKFEWSR